MKTHDLAKPFQCSTCNRGYVTAAALTAHMQGHKVQNQLAKRLKHFAKYQANCLPGLVPVDLIKSIMTCSQQLQPQPVSQNQLPNLTGLNNSTNGLNSIPNNSFSSLPITSNTNQSLLSNEQLNTSNLIQPLISPLLSPLNTLNNNLLQNSLNNNMNINLNNQLNVNLIQQQQQNILKENSLTDQLVNEKHLTISPSPSLINNLITSPTKRSIVEDERENCKRMRTSSISEKDENSCSSSFNSVNDQSLDDEEEVDVTSYEEEERSNSVNSLISNSLSSSANSTEDRNGELKNQNKTTINKKQSTNDKQKKYSCRFCSSNFDYKRSCDRHEKSIHTGERRFQCPECPNRYSR